MILIGLGGVALAVWLVLIFGRGWFWLARERDTRAQPVFPATWPEVVAVVPARDEAEVIAASIASLLAQHYAGRFRVVLVDDSSSDGTADIARGLLSSSPSPSGEGMGVGAFRLTETDAHVDSPHPNPSPEGEGLKVDGPGAASGCGSVAPGADDRAWMLKRVQHDDWDEVVAPRNPAVGLDVLQGAPLADGWTGKLWAVSQGVARAGGAPTYLWLTDADIAHAPDTLTSLVARAEAGKLAMVSLMAKLRCESMAERGLIPAFVFFFQMLYPFRWVNRPGGIGAAAGGCMLVRREALEAAGGIAAIRTALIDDCALGAALKRQGPVWLGLTERSRSIRPYETLDTVAAMISRSAYAQLGYNPLLLLGTLAGLALVYGAPPLLTLFGHGAAQWLGGAAWVLMALSFQPMLAFYRRPWGWGMSLPGIAAFYAGCTLLSAWQHHRGRGGMWKGRAQAAVK